jgi:hypothetical protein
MHKKNGSVLQNLILYKQLRLQVKISDEAPASLRPNFKKYIN